MTLKVVDSEGIVHATVSTYADAEAWIDDHDGQYDIVEEPPPFYSVCIYLMDRAYGGPEEGGWWYDCGEPQYGTGWPLPRIVGTLDEAQAYADELQAWIDQNNINAGRYPISSVLSTGRYVPHITPGLPAAFPKVRPHYE